MLGARCKVRGGSERELTMLTILTILVQGCARCEEREPRLTMLVQGCARCEVRDEREPRAKTPS